MRTPRQQPDTRASADPVYRLILVVDIKDSTKRTNLIKGDLRYLLYLLLEQALQITGISVRHLERFIDRGDGVLILIRPHDDVPKTLVVGRLLPVLTALLVKHNEAMSTSQPDLCLRLRAVVHAGEVHQDEWSFYGDAIDTACRLLDSPKLRQALPEAGTSPLALAVSDEIFTGTVQHEDLDAGPYHPLGQIRVGNRRRRGWITVPVAAELDDHAATTWPPNQVPPSRVDIASAS